MKKLGLCIYLIIITLILGGCLPGYFPLATSPTPSPTPPVDNATMFGVALADISVGQGGYLPESQFSPRTDTNLMVELNKLFTNRVYKEAFVAEFEIIDVVWLTPNNNPGMEDVLIMVDCDGHQNGDCALEKTTSETIFILQWLPVASSSSIHPESITNDRRFWAFPANIRYVFFYTYNTKQRQGFIRFTGGDINAYLNDSLPGESLSIFAFTKVFP